jgi:phage replication O-like protein O
MTNVQPENGFTRVANELLEVVAYQKFNGTQSRIILTLWRYTYGFSRKEHDLSLTFISRATGIHKQQVKKEMDKLIENKVILVTEESTYNTSRKIKFNKDYSQWKDLQLPKELTVSENAYPTVSESTDTTVSENAYPTVSEFAYQERKYKESIKEKERNELVMFFQSQLGQIGSMQMQDLVSWVDEIDCELIKKAITITKENRISRNKWNYARSILVNWSKTGITKLSDLEKVEDSNKKVIEIDSKTKRRAELQKRADYLDYQLQRNPHGEEADKIEEELDKLMEELRNFG